MSRWAAASWVTFVINISGSFAIGLLAMILAHWLPHPHARLLILTGFLGGYTTFSTLAYESAILWERGDQGLAFANLAGSLVAGLIAALLGMSLARDILIPASERSLPSGKQAQVAGQTMEDQRLAEDDEGSPDLELPADAEQMGLIESEMVRKEKTS